MPSQIRTLKVANVLAFLVTIAVNAAANIIPLNGVTTAELSDKYGNLFTPAGYVFSIWGVIYILLAAFTYYQYTADDEELHEKIGWLFVVSSFFNSVWIFLWHYEYVALSLVAMTGLLVSLILIYRRLEIGLKAVLQRKKYMVNTTFSVYLGWITVAPIANIAAFLVSLGWAAYNTSAIYITAVLILVAMALALLYIITRSDTAYAGVIVWALGGIVQKQMTTWLLPYVAGLSIVVIIVAWVLKRTGRLG
jgi:benzodiazapine receptor